MDRAICALALGGLVAGWNGTAHAQAATSSTLPVCSATSGGQPTLSPANTTRPERFLNGQDLGPSTRPANLNPDGINFQDCISDMTLQFSVMACNFSGQDIQVWASLNSLRLAGRALQRERRRRVARRVRARRGGRAGLARGSARGRGRDRGSVAKAARASLKPAGHGRCTTGVVGGRP